MELQRGWISGHDRLLSLKSQIRTPKIIPLCPLPLPLPPTALPLLPPPQHPPGPPRGALPPGPSPCSQGPSPSSWQMTQSQPVGEEEGDRNNDRPTGVPSDHHHVNMKDSGEGDGAGGGDGGLPLPLSAETGLQQASVPPPSQGNQSAPPPWMPPATSGPSPTPCTSSGMPGPSTSSDSSASQQPPPPPGQTPRNKRLAYLKGTGARPHPNNTGDLPPLRTPRQGQTGPRGGPGTLAFGRPPMPGPTGPPGPLMMHPRPDAHSAGVLYPPTAHPLPVGMQPDARMPPDLIFPGHMLVNGQDCVPPPIQDGSHEPSIEEETDGDGLRQGERRRQEKETAVVGRRPGGDGAGGTTATPGTRSGSSTAEGEEELEGPAKGDGKGSAKALQAAGGAKGKRRGRVDSKEGVAGMGERGKVGGGLRGCCGRAAIASLHD
uniref:Uncharacterized protein n=1 Tax=Chromera velia CCMP2878 TaxID=1169474 RepID=A0A0G4HB50_9ALVE|eukprot:Cvel_6157.t1-p1 / transcript=Cvel_6157.t1 / gene=Cvel_6157 / organism=Chromera_velia_CCMP2878 / gene_product=hypothetical protein / transcript_product=hypothetical protein / location=Cvel_scaffold297:102018-104379(-) / protein_length=432 / sequence_SO=supercontig / SO=protein_coding / is_pseudo=false